MTEGPEAFTRFRDAVKAFLTVPKAVIVENERKRKAAPKRKRTADRKG